MNSRAVLVGPLRPELGVSGDHDGLLVADLRHPDAVESLLGRIHRNGELPLVTCRAADLEAVRRLVTFASVRYPGLRAAIEPLPGSPLCVGVISSLVDDITSDTYTPAGEVLAWRLAALDLLREHVWSAVWLPTVAGLDEPTPGLAKHVRSWLPGSGFLAVHAPEPDVLPASRAPLTGLEERTDCALVHSPPTRHAWVVDAMRDAIKPASVSELSTVREPIDSFGTAEAIEFLTVPLSFHSHSRPDPGSVTECVACGIRHARHACPVCRMSAQPLGVAPMEAAL
jgi:hypothetical protein